MLALIGWSWFTRPATMRLASCLPLDPETIFWEDSGFHAAPIFFASHDLLLQIDHAAGDPHNSCLLTLTDCCGVPHWQAALSIQDKAQKQDHSAVNTPVLIRSPYSLASALASYISFAEIGNIWLALSPDGHVLALMQREGAVYHVLSWRDGRLLGDVRLRKPIPWPTAFSDQDNLLQVTDAGRVWLILSGASGSWLWAIDGSQVACGSTEEHLANVAPWSSLSPDGTMLQTYIETDKLTFANQYSTSNFQHLQVIGHHVQLTGHIARHGHRMKNSSDYPLPVWFYGEKTWFPHGWSSGTEGCQIPPGRFMHEANGWKCHGALPFGMGVLQQDPACHLRVATEPPGLPWSVPAPTNARPVCCSRDGRMALVIEDDPATTQPALSRLPLLGPFFTHSHHRLVVYSRTRRQAVLPLQSEYDGKSNQQIDMGGITDGLYVTVKGKPYDIAKIALSDNGHQVALWTSDYINPQQVAILVYRW